MAARSVIVDLEDPTPDTLDFLDIPHSQSTSKSLDKAASGKDKSSAYEQTHTFTNFPHDDSQDEDDSADLLEGGGGKKKQPASFWTFEYYQTFFNVDTRQVLSRVAHSMIPNPNANYLQTQIRPNPDLYGPFWICTTLVFSIAVAGNIASYFKEHAGATKQWQYDFHKVTFAATTIFVYWWLMPSLLYALLWWRGNKANYTFTELLCIYGYSLAVYIPISILWMIDVFALQVTLLVVGMALSGLVLVFTLWPSVKDDQKQIALGSMIAVMLLHGLLAVGFLFYFFAPSPAVGLSTFAPYNSTSTVTFSATSPTTSPTTLSTKSST